jgi:hypothetical protein
LTLILGLAGVRPAAAGDEPTLEQILERYVEALGGREALSKLETRVISGRQIDDRPYQGPPVEAKLTAWADTTGAWTMILDEPEGEYREGFDGEKSWVQKPGALVQVQDHQNIKLAFLFNPQGPLRIAEYFPNLRLTGTWEYDGVQYYKVENDLKFAYYTLYFEVETGMLTRIGYHWWLEGFRPLDGVLVPAKVVRGRKGGSTNLYFDTVTHGAAVGDHLHMGGKAIDE